MARAVGWYRKRAGKQVRTVVPYCNCIVSHDGVDHVRLDVDSREELDMLDDGVDRHERLYVDMTVPEARGLAEQLLEMVARAESGRGAVWRHGMNMRDEEPKRAPKRSFALFPGQELLITADFVPDRPGTFFHVGKELVLVEQLSEDRWKARQNDASFPSGPVWIVLSTETIQRCCKPVRLGQLACCSKCGMPMQPYEEEHHKC